MKKLTVIGRGTVGGVTVAHFLKHTDWEIDWIFDETIPTAAVGEGSDLRLLHTLVDTLELTSKDLFDMNGTIKTGVYKKNWGGKTEFIHPFLIDTHAIHFNAKELHEKIFEKINGHPRVNIKNEHVKDPESLDSDYVIVCTGNPKKITDEFVKIKDIPVNSVYVTQCYWDAPKFSNTLQIAMEHGWVFGVPLQNRVAIGYLYNDKYATLNDVKQDVEKIFKDYNLTPSDQTINFNVIQYYRKQNFSNKVIYNGNASFFIDPMEATAVGLSTQINRWAWDLWHGNLSIEQCQEFYENEIESITLMILMHYLAGSIYSNSFWKYAYKKAYKAIKVQFKNKTNWARYICSSMQKNYTVPIDEGWFHPWGKKNYEINIDGMNLRNKFKKIKKEAV